MDEDMIIQIVGILERNEDTLSDGYGYYTNNVKATLREIAIEIINRMRSTGK